MPTNIKRGSTVPQLSTHNQLSRYGGGHITLADSLSSCTAWHFSFRSTLAKTAAAKLPAIATQRADVAYRDSGGHAIAWRRMILRTCARRGALYHSEAPSSGKTAVTAARRHSIGVKHASGEPRADRHSVCRPPFDRPLSRTAYPCSSVPRLSWDRHMAEPTSPGAFPWILRSPAAK